MNYRCILSAAVVAMTAGISNADVAGLIQTTSYYESDGTTDSTFSSAAYAVVDLYLDFTEAGTDGYPIEDAFLLNLYGINVTARGFSSFNQSDLTAEGSWLPSFSLPVGDAKPNIDSFVTLGTPSASSPNTTALDPNFNNGANADIFGTDIGWYAPPNPSQGGVDENLQVWIGRFAVTGEEARNGADFTITGNAGYYYGPGTGPFSEETGGTFSFIPAPGVLAVLGMGGMLRPRKRRL
jgi:hypothetical protein